MLLTHSFNVNGLSTVIKKATFQHNIFITSKLSVRGFVQECLAESGVEVVHDDRHIDLQIRLGEKFHLIRGHQC